MSVADTQHLQVTAPPGPVAAAATPVGNENAETTPHRRGHRHKRSFAISGDFEFVKTMEPSSVPPPLPLNVTSPTPVSPTPLEPDYATKATSSGLQSPKFFVSEEPKFSSPFKGVPDAIINLEDALKTKPRSFKSHRRAESAPADLEVFMNMKNSSHDTREESGCIEEEEDGDLDVDASKAAGDNGSHLLSPLRPRSPTPGFRNNKSSSGSHSGSPLKHSNANANSTNIKENNSGSHTYNNNNGGCSGGNFNNSLKINRQKQRYYHYTKQLPIQAASQIQSQSLRGQASSGSLSSAYMQTPASLAHTPSKQMSTPLTPVSNGNSRFHAKNVEKPTSPTIRSHKNHNHSHNQIPNKNGSNSTIFNYESKLYDMPHSITVTKSPSTTSNDNRTLNPNQDLSFSQVKERQQEQLPKQPFYASSLSLNSSGSSDKKLKDESESSLIPKSLLLGEPGDVEDPTASLNREFAEGLRPVTADSGLPSRSGSTSDGSQQESRTVSDSVCITERERPKNQRKKKSRLSSFMSLFAKSPPHH